MKYLLIISLLIIPMLFIETNTTEVEKPPAPLRDSKIERVLSNGKVQKFDGNEYIIVKRGPKKPKAVIPIFSNVCEEVVKTETVEKVVVVEKETTPKNILSLKLVDGYRDSRETQNGNTATLITERQLGVGLQYQMNFWGNWYLGVEADSNKGNGASLGRGF